MDDKPAFMLNGNMYELGNKEGYRRFWAIYHRPPKEEYRNYLLERRDSLIAIDERSFKGAFYTPLHVVDKAYDMLSETLGKNWQKNSLYTTNFIEPLSYQAFSFLKLPAIS
jgi:hypothetical protein